MIFKFPDDRANHTPSRLRLLLRRAVRVRVGALDLLATVDARRKGADAWGEWVPVVDLVEGDGVIWCGDGCVVELRCAGHTALSLEDDVAPEALPNVREVRSALAWLGLDTSGTRRQLNARLEASP